MDNGFQLTDYYQKTFPVSLKDLAGREALKNMLQSFCPASVLDRILELQNSSVLLLSGPKGTGKKTLVLALAGELHARGIKCLFLKGRDLSGKDGGEAKERIRILADELSRGEPLFVCLKEPEELAEKEGTELLGKVLGNLRRSTLPISFFAITEKEESIPMDLWNVFTICRVAFPNLEDRMAFFQKKWPLGLHMESKLSFEAMANKTEGLSYYELDHLLAISKRIFKGYGLRIYQSEELFLTALQKKELFLTERQFDAALSMTAKEEPALHKPEEREKPEKQGEKISYNLKFKDLFREDSPMNPNNL